MKEDNIVHKKNSQKEKICQDYSPETYQLPNIFMDNEETPKKNLLLVNQDFSKIDINSEIDFNQNIFGKNPIQDSTSSSENDPSFKSNEDIMSKLFSSHSSQDQEVIKNRPKIQLNMNNPPFNNINIITKSMPQSKISNALNNQMDLFSPIPENKPIQLTQKAILTSLKNQSTTLILQKIIMDSDKAVIESILKELKGLFRRIMMEKNGNYFISDLIKVCDQSQRISILEEIYPFLSEDSVNNFATHPIQTLIEYSSSEKEYSLILESFNDYNKLLFASLDPNGAYVIQKIIERIPEKYRIKFNYIFISFISFVSKKKFGIITVKKFISCTKSEEIISQMLNSIKMNFMCLAVDKYGNYLIQFLFDKWKYIPAGNAIKELIMYHFKVLSESKYSSFICELFIRNANKEEKNKLINTLDINEIKNSDNPYSMKILKSLGLLNNSGNNINNNFQNQMNLPMTLNNHNQNNIIPSNFIVMNFGNNNNINNNFEDKNHKNIKHNNNKNKYKKKNSNNN